MKLFPLALRAALVAFPLATISSWEAAPLAAATSGPSFTKDQVAKGHQTFTAKCAMCHGANLEGISGPALKGKDAALQQKTVRDIYAYVTAQMPVGNAGGLPSNDYVNVMAFLLQSNGRAVGQKKLTVATLKGASSNIGGPH